MSKKMTISVPDFLHEKIEQWRESFNFSRLFQETVSDAIRKKEELSKHLKNEINIPEIVERLKREKLESEIQYFDEGEKAGIEWASRAHYLELIEALRQSAEKLSSHDSNLQNYFRSILKHHKINQNQDEIFQKYSRLFLSGWKKGVEEFWDSIKDKLGEQ